MFREMRRKKQLLPTEESIAILEKATSGVLAVLGDEGYPYAVPLSYVYDDGKLYFHGAKSGHKLDAIMAEPKVSFCVIDQDNVIPEEYTTYFRSVIVFGKARIIEDEEELNKAIENLAIKYAPNDSAENREKAIEKEKKYMCMFVLEIEHMTGKEAIELRRVKLAKNREDEM